MRHERGGSYVVDKGGNFRFLRGYTKHSIGTEIKIVSQTVTTYTKVVALAACILFVFSLGSYGLLNYTESFAVYIDINPSVELVFNKINNLKYSSAMNNDGVSLLENMKLKGIPENIIVQIILEAQKTGVLVHNDNTTSVEITLVSLSGKLPHNIISKLIKALKENGLDGIVSINECTEQYQKIALSLGVSPGKLKLAETLLQMFPNANIEDLLKSSVLDLTAAIMGSEDSKLLNLLKDKTKTDEPSKDNGVNLPKDTKKEEEKKEADNNLDNEDTLPPTNIQRPINNPSGDQPSNEDNDRKTNSNNNNSNKKDPNKPNKKEDEQKDPDEPLDPGEDDKGDCKKDHNHKGNHNRGYGPHDGEKDFNNHDNRPNTDHKKSNYKGSHNQDDQCSDNQDNNDQGKGKNGNKPQDNDDDD